MAGTDKTVKVTLVAVAQPYTKGMNDAATATRKLGDDIDRAGTKSKGLGGSLSGAASSLKGLGAAAAGTAVAAFLTESVQAAGDLQQSLGGVDAVFKDTAQAVHAFGETSAEAVGLSRNEFNKLITTTGAMLKNKGLEEFTQKSIDLVKVGADLAAQFGGSTADAVGALNAAMRGESDPIERYGISLNETAVNAELAEKGLKGLTGQALEQAKAQARIDIVMRQSADALGAFSREADTLQGQQQRLNAEWEDAKASLGTALLPVLTDVVGALRSGVDIALAAAGAFDKIPGPVKAAAAALIALRIAHDPLSRMGKTTVGTMRSLGEAIQYAGDSARRAGGGFTGLSAGVKTFTGSAGLASSAMSGLKSAGSGLMALAGGPWGIALAGLTAAFGGYIQAQQNAEAAAKSLLETMDKQAGAFTNASRINVRDALMGDLSPADQKLLSDMGISFTEAADATIAGGDALSGYIDKINGLRGGASDEAKRAIQGLGQSIRNNGDVAADARLMMQVLAKEEKSVGDEAKIAEPKLADYSGVINGIKDASIKAKDAQKDLAQAMLDITDAAASADQAEANWQQALDDASAAIEENGRTVNRLRTELDLSTEAGRNNQSELINLRDRAREVAEANLTQGDSVDSVKTKMQAAREEFIEAARKMGLSKDAAEKLATQYGLTKDDVDALKVAMDKIPQDVKSTVTVATGGAMTAIAAVKAALTAIRDEEVRVYVTRQDRWRGEIADQKFASGGRIIGPGTGTSDSIPAWLSNGEYVVRAAAVQKYGTQFFDGLNAMKFASGGHVSRMPPGGGGSASLTLDYSRLAAEIGRLRPNTIYAGDSMSARAIASELDYLSQEG